ncbi:MAG: DUF1573 domain-containing protein [Bacteroidales bacterium]|jgi:hypothetical protein|nr:DUF1573 domain-containing protein [Bacteroidales bacterium]
MKTLIKAVFVISICGIMVSCNQDTNRHLSSDLVKNSATASGDSSDDMPVISFEELTHEFGKIISGEKVSYGFKFKNTGKSDLLISSVSASCGCTAPSYPSKPIAPGEEGVIMVSFNSENRKGFQHKTITVSSNSNPANVVLNIKADVIQPEMN